MYAARNDFFVPSRRALLKGAAATGGAFVLGTFIGGKAFAAAPGDAPLPNAFIRIGIDDTVTVLTKHLEMGQGVTTGLSTIVAEELDADWTQVRAEHAPANPAFYNNLAFGQIQGTGGSTSVANSWEQLRKAGAAMRQMLVEAAAERWGVSPAAITVAKGVVTHRASGRSARFGELAEAAAKRPVPASVRLKDAKEWTLIGARVPRIDSVDKTTGRTVFALDVKRPGQLIALIKRPERFGATVKSFDAAAAKAIKGVVDVVVVPAGVAVLAENTFAAMQGRDAVKVEWDESKAETRGSDEIIAEYRRLAQTPGTPAASRGEAEGAIGRAQRVVETEFTFPYLAHAPMEPLNCTVELKDDGCEIWAGSQFQTVEQAVAGGILGLKPEHVKINTLSAGGSFGRRATVTADYIAEAVHIAKAIRGRAPVHLVWTREDDIRGGYYRPIYLHRLRAGLDPQGNIVGWHHRIVGQSILSGTPMEPMMVKDGVDATSVEGANNLPYGIANFRVELHSPRTGVPILWWRSVGSTHTAQATEVFFDELATAAGKDPVAFRLALLDGHPRHAAVLRLAAEKAGWGKVVPKGKGFGVAVHESFNSYVAQIAEVTVDGGGLKVDRIVCAVDCGIAVNPDVVAAQMEGGIGFGLGAALRNKITLTKGVVDQSNFHDYEPLRISDMPKVEVYIVRSDAAPTGVGEPGVPPVAPAVANAVFAATGKRLRSLPFDLEALKGA
jgi:isoquinoline 1-oxidoreductase beta subunit